MKQLLALLVTVTLTLQIGPAGAADGLVVDSTTSITSEVPNIGQIWKGEIPTLIGYPTDSTIEKLDFQIIGILPISQLADRSLGVEVEFAIWSDSGVKLGSQTIYSFSWNPVGPKTMVSMYLYSNPSLYGKQTMLITTSYYTSTNGLLSKYLKDEKRVPIEIKKLVSSKIPDPPSNLRGEWVGSNLSYTFKVPQSFPEVTSYEIGIADSVAGMSGTFYEPTVVKKITNNSFLLTPGDFLKTVSLKNDSVIVKVRAVNSVGNSSWSAGIYTPVKDLNTYGISLIPPPANISCNFSSVGVDYSASTTFSVNSIATGVPNFYDWEYAVLNSAELPPNLYSSYGEPIQIKSTSGNTLSLTLREILVLTGGKLNTSIMVNAYSRNNIGNSGLRGGGCYISVSDLSTYVNVTVPAFMVKAKQEAEAAAKAKAAAELKAKLDAEAKAAADKAAAELKIKQESDAKAAAAKAAALKKTTITCIKGKLTKKVTAVKPVCPTGYKKQ